VTNTQITKVLKDVVEEIGNQSYRLAVILWLEGFSLREMAEATGKNVGAVKNDYVRGRNAVKKILQERGFTIK
jgi:DNA-directed RNA polymerase specialized sigma24 family protein